MSSIFTIDNDNVIDKGIYDLERTTICNCRRTTVPY